MAKFGTGMVGGMWRQGLAELRAIFYTQSNVASPTDPGMYGKISQGEAADLRRDEPAEAAPEQPSVLDARMEATKELAMEMPEPDMNLDLDMG